MRAKQYMSTMLT